MSLELVDVSGNPFIGVFCRLVGDALLCPRDVADDYTRAAESALGVTALKVTLGNTHLHGSLIAANSKGAVVPFFFDEGEIRAALNRALGEERGNEINILLSDEPHTAWGNNLLVSEKAAMYNPDLSGRFVREASDRLDVEMVPGTIAGVSTVGSIAVLNTKGIIAHPKATEGDLDLLKDVFGLRPEISTANFGSPHLGASVIANDKGALIGNKSSGVEMNRIENALDLI